MDFIVNVLKEHEKDLDRLIKELGSITERLGDTGELSGKIEKVEERLTTLQNEITNLITYLSAPRETTQTSTHPATEQKTAAMETRELRGPPVILRCKQWEDFQALAHQAQTVSFLYREAEKSFQVDALKKQPNSNLQRRTAKTHSSPKIMASKTTRH